MELDAAAEAQSVYESLREDGMPVTLVRNTAPGADYDPVTGSGASVPSETTVETFGVLLAVTSGYVNRVGKEHVQTKDRLLLLPGTADVQMKDVVQFENGARWQVVNVEELAPNGVPIMYTVQVRP